MLSVDADAHQEWSPLELQAYQIHLYQPRLKTQQAQIANLFLETFAAVLTTPNILGRPSKKQVFTPHISNTALQHMTTTYLSLVVLG